MASTDLMARRPERGVAPGMAKNEDDRMGPTSRTTLSTGRLGHRAAQPLRSGGSALAGADRESADELALKREVHQQRGDRGHERTGRDQVGVGEVRTLEVGQ